MEGKLYFRATNMAGKVSTGEVAVGKPFDSSWNGVMMRVDAYYPKARLEQRVEEAGRNAAASHNNPIARVRLERNGKQSADFVVYNTPKTMSVDSEIVNVEFGQRRVPAGFTMQLLDFRAPRYPGTNQPERFESDVLVTDDAKGIEWKQKVHMNFPLYYNRFNVYQASYVEGKNGEPDISIFSVAQAPGTPIIYIGSIVMVVGMIVLYQSRKLYFPDSDQPDF